MTHALAPQVNIFLSLGGALSALYHGRLAASDLQGALFYFPNPRQEVIIDPALGVRNWMGTASGDDPERALEAYRTLLSALTDAEAAERVLWPDLDLSVLGGYRLERQSWDGLNLLLGRNGLVPLQPLGQPEPEKFGGHLALPFPFSAVDVMRAAGQEETPYRIISG